MEPILEQAESLLKVENPVKHTFGWKLGVIPVVILAIDPSMHKVIGDNPYWAAFVAAVLAVSAYFAKSPIGR